MKKINIVLTFIFALILAPLSVWALDSEWEIQTTETFNLSASEVPGGTQLEWNEPTYNQDNLGFASDEDKNHYFLLRYLSYKGDEIQPLNSDNWPEDFYGNGLILVEKGEKKFSYLATWNHFTDPSYYVVCIGSTDHPIACSTPLFVERQVRHSAFFSDLHSDHQYFPSIEYLAREGVLKGNPDGTFDLRRPVNRAEMVRLVLANLGIEPDPQIYNNCFPDVTDQWFAPDVCKAKELGWIAGNPDGYFRPADEVSPPAVLKMILGSLFEQELATQTSSEIEEIASQLANVDVEDWYAPYVTLAKNKGILYDSHSAFFQPYQTSYRDLVAEYLLRAELVKKQGWEAYHPYLRDHFFQNNDSGDLLFKGPSCYSMWPMKAPDFLANYMKTEYGVTDFQRNLFSKLEFPFIDSGYVCALSDGGTLFSNAIVFDSKTTQKHLIRFDSENNLVEDQKTPTCRTSSASNFDTVSTLFLEDGFDVDTLEILDCYYAKDKNQLYPVSEFADPIDLETFEVLGGGYSRDKNYFYYRTRRMDLDPETFELFSDPTHFEILGEHYLKIKDTFYHGNSIIEADQETFKILNDLYWADKTGVYRGSEKCDNLDVDTLEILEGNYMKDKDSAYYFCHLINNIDGETVEVVEKNYLKDKNHVYFWSKLMEGADPASFVVLSNGFAKDKNQVYYHNKLLKGLDPDDFEIMGDNNTPYKGYIKDQDQVFWNNQELDWADPSTFKYLGWGFAKDKNYAAYDQYTVPDAHPATFEIVEEWFPNLYARDKNNVYCRFKKVGGLIDFDYQVTNSPATCRFFSYDYKRYF